MVVVILLMAVVIRVNALVVKFAIVKTNAWKKHLVRTPVPLRVRSVGRFAERNAALVVTTKRVTVANARTHNVSRPVWTGLAGQTMAAAEFVGVASMRSVPRDFVPVRVLILATL